MSRATNLLLLVLVFAFSMGVAEGMPQGATGTPTLVQHVSTGRENTAGTNPSLKVTLPNPTLAGDALILGVEGTSSLTIGTPTDNEGNTWIAGPMINTGGETVASFYVLNAAAGTQVITTPYTGTSSQLNISAVLSEFNNVQTSGAIGPTGTIGSASPVSITLSGSPNLGDLVWMWGADTVTIDPVLKSITAGTNFNLLSANLQAGKMAQYSTSTTSPTASFTTSGTDMFNAVALTLHAASAGTAPGPGIRIVHMQGEWYDTTTHAAQFPCSGNLLVISLASTGVTISAISDSNGNTWSLGASALTSGETAQIMYAANAITSPNMTVNLTYSDPTSYGLNFVHFYDISGALASPHDVDDTRTGDQTTNGNLTSGIITPSQINSLVLNITAIYWHTINGTGTDANGHTPTLNQAVNSVDDDVNPPGTPASQLDDDDGRASVYNSDTKQITFIYTSTAGTRSPNGDGDWASVTSVFKPAYTLPPEPTPTVAPGSETFTGSVSVSINDTDNVATILYTTDGSTPAPGGKTTQTYSTPFIVTATTTVQAIATETGYANSAVTAATYTVQTAPTPMIAPGSETFTGSVSVSISDTYSTSTILYTTDGSTPAPGGKTTQTYSTPFSVTTTTTVQAMATASGYANSPVAAATYTLQSAAPSIRVRAGTSTSYTDPSGNVWAGDVDYSGGTEATPVTHAITNTTTQPLYQTERYNGFTYTFTGLPVGASYAVTLKFAEDYWTAAGKRIFNVILNGTTVLSNFDIFADADGEYIADDKTFSTTVNSSGQIVIQFQNGSADCAKIDAIQLIPSGPSLPTPQISPGTETFTGSVSVSISDTYSTSTILYTTDGSTPAPGGKTTQTYSTPFSVTTTTTVQAVATASGYANSPIAAATYTLQSAAPSIRVRAGTSTSYTDPSGNVWAGDVDYSGGTEATPMTHAVANTTTQPLYQTERYNGITYTFTGLPTGTSYAVTLKFSENYWTAAGKRIFNVILNGTTVLSNFDIFADAGGQYIADDKTFNTTVNSSGQIVIQFQNGSVDYAKIDAIQLVP